MSGNFLNSICVHRRTGTEHLHRAGEPLGSTLLHFWHCRYAAALTSTLIPLRVSKSKGNHGARTLSASPRSSATMYSATTERHWPVTLTIRLGKGLNSMKNPPPTSRFSTPPAVKVSSHKAIANALPTIVKCHVLEILRVKDEGENGVLILLSRLLAMSAISLRSIRAPRRCGGADAKSSDIRTRRSRVEAART